MSSRLFLPQQADLKTLWGCLGIVLGWVVLYWVTKPMFVEWALGLVWITKPTPNTTQPNPSRFSLLPNAHSARCLLSVSLFCRLLSAFTLPLLSTFTLLHALVEAGHVLVEGRPCVRRSRPCVRRNRPCVGRRLALLLLYYYNLVVGLLNFGHFHLNLALLLKLI